MADSESFPLDQFQFDFDQIINFCDRFNETPEEEHYETILEVKLKDLDSRWSRLDTSYESVMLTKNRLVEPEDKKKITEKYNTCTNEYYKCTSKIFGLLKQFQIDNERVQSSTRYSMSNHIPPPINIQDNSSNCIKLPPCDTEIFNGSYEQWPSFRDMFTAVYINHTKLSAVTKLYHLRNKTRGEAGDIVKRYALSNDNFALAWNALESRYENKRVLVDNQIKVLFDIPPATSENSESIRRIQSSVNDSLATLKTLGVEIESWDPILIRLISTKLPDLTLALWEQSLKAPRELPKWSQMSQFLVDRYEAVERLTSIKNSKDGFNVFGASKVQTYSSLENLSPACRLCKSDHQLRTCPKFRAFTVQQRVDFVYKNKYCGNCLGHSHLKANCKSRNTCTYCKKTHHTLLHMVKRNQEVTNKNEIFQKADIPIKQVISKPASSDFSKIDYLPQEPSCSVNVQANCSVSNEKILLRTALMQIECRGEYFTVRALIDPGSQRTFLSEKIRSRLQLPYRKSHFEIIGIGGQKQFATKECDFTLYAKRKNLRLPITAIVLPSVTKRLPACSFTISRTKELDNLDLADPTFNQSSQIDLILGNDYEHDINLEGIKKNICGKSSAYNTIFGWVLSGPMATDTVHSLTTEVVNTDDSKLCYILKKFWEDEEIPSVRQSSEEDNICENFYSQTTRRLKDGKYMVRLPFKKDFPDEKFLDSSRFIALAQYTRMEKTLFKNPDLQSQYNAVLNEYLTLDHMEETSSQEIVHQNKFFSFYLPHHAVVRPEHKTTKVRVVFNASQKTKSKFSLNDVLYTGPTLQNDLITTILNWRKYKFVFSGDIQKMYRQILVHPEDRVYQRILFQDTHDNPIKDYQLKTVTFGVNCAPFLAIRTLLQLASDSESIYPKAATILRSETYVDDILSGGYSLEDALDGQNQLLQTLRSAGLPLKKITANDKRLLSHLPKDDLYDMDFLRFHESSSTKTLGIKWNALTDSFTYSFVPIEQTTKLTKRQILSSVAKLFDPAGWLSPIVIRAKTLMQQLWLEGLRWDDQISSETLQKWNELVADLATIDSIHISRWLQYSPLDITQIHGFCDASKTAYCATVYIRCQTNSNVVFTNLLVAKCKVAPIQTISLPRLELCGALLLAKLVNYVDTSLNFGKLELHMWTDSSIVLGWLSKPPSTWETYVANRTSKIYSLVPTATWRHIPTHFNPADLGTRGCKPRDLAQNSLWWHGPSWLQLPFSQWPKKNPLNSTEEIENASQVFYTKVEDNDILNRFSSYSKALRVVCYVFRFFNKCLKQIRPTIIQNSHKSPTHTEMRFTRSRLIILVQKKFYKEEYQQLIESQNVPNNSSIKNLNPFLDSDSVLRANGRLSQSSLPYNERYPIILPGSSRFCHLYLEYLHQCLAHAECSQMVRMVQNEFYISRLKPRIKGIIRRCKTCVIYKQQPCSQIMAPLPPDRCNLSLPFQVTGIDFAGPFDLKTSPLRKSSTTKGYVCVFVCFGTKAVHLEACSDLSSAAFQATFARFVGRRGLPQRVTSDNGRNFLGASRVLKREFAAFVKTSADDISQKYITHGFEWKFIPPHAPHMGGLWEAAVKSFKYHFKRITCGQKFTFEEFATLLARIEGVLNSRPMSALSDDPEDLTSLTPGHFLRGAPLMAFPEQDYQQMSIINRWDKLKALHHQFSIRWKNDYLKSLHKRYKWKNAAPNIQVGDLVVVIDDLLPPHEWRLGRIVKIFLGVDGNVRTVEVRTTSGVIVRPIVKLCYLPLLNDENCH